MFTVMSEKRQSLSVTVHMPDDHFDRFLEDLNILEVMLLLAFHADSSFKWMCWSKTHDQNLADTMKRLSILRWNAYLPLRQQVLGCWLLRNSFFVGRIYQDVACGLSLSQPVEELVQVEGELLQELQSCLQSCLPVWNPGVTCGMITAVTSQSQNSTRTSGSARARTYMHKQTNFG